MKKLILLFLVLGIVFAVDFPQSIYGTSLVLYEYEGEVASGLAYYYNEDMTVGAAVSSSYMSSSDWENSESAYLEYGWTETSEPGMPCWYVCDSATDEYGDYYYCYIDCYYESESIYFMIDSYIDGSVGTSIYDPLYEGLAVASEMKDALVDAGFDGGNGGSNGGNGGGGSGNGDSASGQGACPCASTIVLIGLTLTGLTLTKKSRVNRIYF